MVRASCLVPFPSYTVLQVSRMGEMAPNWTVSTVQSHTVIPHALPVHMKGIMRSFLAKTQTFLSF